MARTYAEDLALWRQQRAQQQINNRLQEIRSEHAQAARERDQLIAENNVEEAAWRDDECKQLEEEWNHYNPPQPQYHPKDINLIQKNANYFQRHPQRGAQAAHYVNNLVRRIGIGPNHPEYEEMMRRGMEFYGERFNAPYDRNSEALTANEARDISGVDTKTYNAAYQQLKAQGRVK
jgi:hypothetical protein